MKAAFVTSLLFAAGAIAAPTAPAKRDLAALKGVVSKANGIINNIEGTVKSAVAKGLKADDIIPGITGQLTDLNETLSGINVGGMVGADAAAEVTAGVAAGVTATVSATISAALSAILGVAVNADVDAEAAVSLGDISVGANVLAELLVNLTGMTDIMAGVPGLIKAGGVADGVVGATGTAGVEGTVQAAVQVTVGLVGSILATVTGALNVLGLGSITSIVPVPI